VGVLGDFPIVVGEKTTGRRADVPAVKSIDSSRPHWFNCQTSWLLPVLARREEGYS